MADNFTPVQAKRFTLSGSGCSSSATSITVTNFELPSGTSITMSMFGTLGYAVLEPGTSRVEVISFTGVTDNGDGTSTLTGVTRGLNFVAPYTGDSSRAFAHVGGSGLVLSNPAVYYSKFASLDNDETVAGQYTFTQTPKTSDVPVSGDDIVNKTYADGLALGGATVDKVVVAATAGETVSAGNLVYFDLTDNEWKKTDADTVATVEGVMLGIAQGSGTNGNAITGGVLIHGVDTNQTGMTQGDPMYASNTAGGIASSAGTASRIIGIARSATNLYFDPYFYYLSTSAFPSAFISTSAGVADAGKGIKTNASGLLDATFTTTPVVRTYTTSGSPHTWTKPSGLKYIIVEVQGAGGGGRGSTTDASENAGGGGGGYAKKLIAAATLGATETATVGTGGTGGDGATQVNGAAGGNSTFTVSGGSTITGNGGSGSNTAEGGAGGSASNGDINIPGGGGGSAGGVSTGFSGFGGGSMFGNPTLAPNDIDEAGITGQGYGSGGSGASNAGTSDRNGGSGANGVIIVTEYYN